MSQVGVAQGREDEGPVLGEARMQGEPEFSTRQCDYKTCALSLRLSRGSMQILRGSNRAPVGTIGFRTPDVASLVASDPEAVTQARVFQKVYVKGGRLMVLGSVIAAAGFQLAYHDGAATTERALSLAGAALAVYGVVLTRDAMRALRHAIAHYNAGLAP